MKCQNCGYENPTEGTKDNKCDQCGYLLIQNNSISAQVDSSELTLISVMLLGWVLGATIGTMA